MVRTVAKGEAFFERLKRLLDEAGLSDAEAAACSGLSVSQISRLKSGEAGGMKLDAALRLCERLGVSPWYLAFGQERAITAPEGLNVRERGNTIHISLMPGTTVLADETAVVNFLEATALALRARAGGDPDRVKAIDLLFGDLGRGQ